MGDISVFTMKDELKRYLVTNKQGTQQVEAEWYSLSDGVNFNHKSPVLRFYIGKLPNQELVAMFNKWDFVMVAKP